MIDHNNSNRDIRTDPSARVARVLHVHLVESLGSSRLMCAARMVIMCVYYAHNTGFL